MIERLGVIREELGSVGNVVMEQITTTLEGGAEGTLGGLVEQGRYLRHHLRRAFELGTLCSGDPVCALHEPELELDDRSTEGAARHTWLRLRARDRDWVAQGKVAVPLTGLQLRERGMESETAALLVRVLGELSRAPLLAILDTLILERDRAERERPRLLWTGPEPPGNAHAPAVGMGRATRGQIWSVAFVSTILAALRVLCSDGARFA